MVVTNKKRGGGQPLANVQHPFIAMAKRIKWQKKEEVLELKPDVGLDWYTINI